MTAPPKRRLSDRTRRARLKHVLQTNAHTAMGVALVAVAVGLLALAAGLAANTLDDRAERAAVRAEARRTCQRTWKIGEPIVQALQRAGLDDASARAYRESIPQGDTVEDACP